MKARDLGLHVATIGHAHCMIPGGLDYLMLSHKNLNSVYAITWNSNCKRAWFTGLISTIPRGL